MAVVETREDLNSQRARVLIALGRRFSTANVAPGAAAGDLLGELVYFTLRNRSVRPSAEADLIQRLVIRIPRDFPDGTYGEVHTWNDLAIMRYLVSLPGIGQFAADQVMLYVLGRPILPIAWPLTRLLPRVSLADQKAALKAVFDTAASLLAPNEHRAFYDNLLEHARDVCVPRSPRCRCCPLTDVCAYHKRMRLRRGFTRI